MPESLERIGFHLPSLAAYLVNFLLLLGLLYIIAYRPFLRMWHEREARLAQGRRDAQEAGRMRAEALEERERVVQAAAKEAARLIAEGRHRADAEVSQLLAQGQREVEASMKRARARMRAEQQRALDDARRRSVDLVVLATQGVLGRTLDRQDHHRIVEAAAKEIAALSLSPSAARFRLARVASAVPLTPDELDQVETAIARLIGSPIPVICHTEPELQGGLTLTIGDTLIDASLLGRLHKLHRQLQE